MSRPRPRRAAASLAAALAVVVGCGGGGDGDEVTVVSLQLPAEVAGTLTITVEEGDPGDDEISAANFGELVTADGLLLVDLDGDVARAAGLTRDQLVSGIAVVAELDAPGIASSPAVPSYRIAALTASG